MPLLLISWSFSSHSITSSWFSFDNRLLICVYSLHSPHHYEDFFRLMASLDYSLIMSNLPFIYLSLPNILCVCLRICDCVCVCVYIYVCLCIRLYKYMCIYLSASLSVSMSASVSVSACVYAACVFVFQVTPVQLFTTFSSALPFSGLSLRSLPLP